MTSALLRRATTAVLLVASLLPATAVAQAPPPPPQACDGWSTALAAGGPGAEKALTEGWLRGCPNIGPDALAAALDRLRTSTDASLLWALTTEAAYVEHPLIFEAALRTAADRGATVEARAASLLILAGQLGSGVGIEMPPDPTRAGTILLTETLPSRRLCIASIAFHVPPSPAAVELPEDADRRAARVFDEIRTSTVEPELLRNLVTCLRSVIDSSIPPQIDVSGVRLAYVCENEFTVYNPTPLQLLFEVEVEGEPEPISFRVHPGETRSFTVDTSGTVRLIYDGRVIQTKQNGDVPCP